jgi:hypothetical protein
MTLKGEQLNDFVMHKITSIAPPRNDFSARLLDGTLCRWIIFCISMLLQAGLQFTRNLAGQINESNTKINNEFSFACLFDFPADKM